MENNDAVTQTENKIEEKAVTQTEQKTEEKTFSQAEVNTMLKNERKSYETKYKDYDKWLESQKTESEKQNEVLQKLTTAEVKLNEANQIISILDKGFSREEAEFIQWKVGKMEGDFENNLNDYIKSYSKKEEKKPITTGFTQQNSNQKVSEEEAYLNKKYASNPYYKK